MTKTTNTFFEGEDFEGGVFKALMPEYYPPEYQKYIREETATLREKFADSKRVLEAGVGTGRLIPEIAPVVDELIGIDTAKLMLQQAASQCEKFQNAKVQEGTLEDLSKVFPANHFDNSLCVWNTLGNVSDELLVLRELAYVTRGSIFITVFLKGTNESRKNLYKTLGVEISHIDEENGVFFTQSGLRSKSYSAQDIQRLAEQADLEVTETKVLGGVILYAELKKRQFES